MSLTLNYDQDNARVEIVVDGLQTAGAVLFTIERSTDQVNWTPVRGAINQPVTDDDPIQFYDYEYTPGPGVTNFYRVMRVPPIEFVGSGAAQHVSNISYDTIQLPLPAGVQEGDLLLVWIAARAGGFGIDIARGNGPTWAEQGWSVLLPPMHTAPSAHLPSTGESALLGKIAGASEPDPVVRLLGSPLSWQAAAFRNASMNILGTNIYPPPPAISIVGQSITLPGLNVIENNALVIRLSHKLSSWSSVATPSGETQIAAPSTTIGDGQGMVWYYQIQSTAQNVPQATNVSVTGGSPENSRSRAIAFAHGGGAAVELFTDSVATPLDVVWLKNPLRPTRNMVVKLGAHRSIGRVARSGLFDVKGRAEPIEITETRRSPAWEQTIVADTFDDYDAILALLATGETLLLHVPGRDPNGGCKQIVRPGGYVHVGNVSETHSPSATLPVGFTVNMQQVAAPHAELGFIEPPESSP